MTTTNEATAPGAIRSLIPARIDRLPWSPFHTRMVVALGVAWILDGLEITVAGAVVALLTKQETLQHQLDPGRASSPRSTWPARSSARSSSARCRTSWAARSCSSSPWPST